MGTISELDWTGLGTIAYTKLKIYMRARTSTQPTPRPLPLYNQCYTKSNCAYYIYDRKWYDYAKQLDTWFDFNNDAVIKILPIDYNAAGNFQSLIGDPVTGYR